jgi:2,4-dienoyl-CoA reductase-like NADH-dependent reductase (Old Yellow Enzyme family)
MSRLFEYGEINGMVLRNRFVRSATWEGMATDEGACTPELISLMARLAEGGVGLIITGHAYVRQEGQAGPWQLGVYKDDLIPGLREMTQAVHEKGGRIVLQLAHAGFYAIEKLTGKMPFAFSLVEGLSKSPRKEMTTKDIQTVVQAFSQAAIRGKEAGFDGVQIHSAHGYLLNQTLSPVFNHRKDEYGGDFHNRARMLREVLRGIRKELGTDYPVLIKMSSQDFVENGLTLEDSVRICVMLEEGGIDAVELSGGLPINPKLGPIRMGIKSEEQEAYFQNGAKAVKEQISVPVILVGGIRSYKVAERLVDQGVADYISMSRPFIREPDLVNRWKGGDHGKAACLSDNQCFTPIREGKGMYCLPERKGKKE